MVPPLQAIGVNVLVITNCVGCGMFTVFVVNMQPLASTMLKAVTPAGTVNVWLAPAAVPPFTA